MLHRLHLQHIGESKRGQKKIEVKKAFFHGLNRSCYKPHINDINPDIKPYTSASPPCVCTYVYMHVCVYVCICVCVYVCLYICMHICMHLCMHISMYVCTYVCMHVSLNIYTHSCIVSPVQVEASSGDAAIRSHA